MPEPNCKGSARAAKSQAPSRKYQHWRGNGVRHAGFLPLVEARYG